MARVVVCNWCLPKLTPATDGILGKRLINGKQIEVGFCGAHAPPESSMSSLRNSPKKKVAAMDKPARRKCHVCGSPDHDARFHSKKKKR